MPPTELSRKPLPCENMVASPEAMERRPEARQGLLRGLCRTHWASVKGVGLETSHCDEGGAWTLAVCQGAVALHGGAN